MTVTLTKALVGNHGAGRADTYGAALLDVAQDHVLYLLDQLDLFEDGTLIFKGGTALRKCRLGNAGRFSTDLDFVAPDDDTVIAVYDAINGAKISGFEFGMEDTSTDGRHWRLLVTHESLGQPDIPASVEFARRPLVVAPERLPYVDARVHRAYDFELPSLPVISRPEAIAEKLARYRRVSLGRDLYDLNQFAGWPFNEALVRRLWVLKGWGDVLVDARGDRPLSPDDILTPRREADFQPDSIGKLTRPVDIVAWEQRVRGRFQFLADLDEEEQRWVACDLRHRREIEAAIAGGGFVAVEE